MKSSSLPLTLAVVGVGGALGFGLARRGGSAPASFPVEGATVLKVPHAQGNIVLDGDMDDPGWTRASARTQAFVGPDGVSPARPHSEARIVWGDGYLYLGLYAADEDIRAESTEHDTLAPGDDAFTVTFSDGRMERVIEVSPVGTLKDGARRAGTGGQLDLAWESEAHVSIEHDGTPNHPGDKDEEWVIEMAIPLEALGMVGQKGESVALSLRRCDTLRSGAVSCGTWGEASADPADPARRGVIVLE